ncbi:MAG: DNA repair and recombination protein RadB [Thermoplasmata archaeon]|nr:DNA repair and recombination protein RadB [Thermoplasmata archaeon]
MKIEVACPSLDALLDGGVESGCITLLFGEAGTGKTNLCLQVARNVAQAGRKVAFIDTEGVSLERLRQICGDEYNRVLPEILFTAVHTMPEQEKAVAQAAKLAETTPEIGLVVLDSATTHYRLREGEKAREKERHSLGRQLTALMAAARRRDIPILITSQVYTKIDTGEYTPLGGHMMSHNAKDILRLEKVAPQWRLATIVKHRHLEEGAGVKFRLTDRGLES